MEAKRPRDDDVESESEASTDDENALNYDSDDSDHDRFWQARHSVLSYEQEQHRRNSEEYGQSDDSEQEDDLSEYDSLGAFQARVNMINGAIGMQYRAKEVAGRHRSACGGCYQTPQIGFYAVDQSNGVYYAPKLCHECVEYRSALLLKLSDDESKFRRVQAMRMKLDEKFSFFDPFAKQGLYENGPDGMFVISTNSFMTDTNKKTFSDHMKCSSNKKRNTGTFP